MKTSLGPQTLLQPTPVWLVGTYDDAGQPNIMAAAWGGICCSRPPCAAVSLRAATYSHGSITAREAFTISLATEALAREADYAGIASGRDVDKFAAAGLTAARSEVVDAPYVDQSPLVAECRLLETHELGLHTQFIGEILDVKADADVLGEDGQPDMLKVRPLIFAPGATNYYGVGELVGAAFEIGKTLG